MTHKPYPHNPQLERMLLGSCMQSARAVEASASLPLDALLPHHSRLMGVLRGMVKARQHIDVLTVCQACEPIADAVGGRVYLLELPDAAPASPHAASTYAEQLAELYRRRRLRALGDILTAKADAAPLPDLMTEARAVLEEAETTGADKSVPLAKVLIEHTEHVCAAVSGEIPAAIPTPWPELNERLNGGLVPGVHLVAGRPGMGKTATALCIAVQAAMSGTPCGIQSLEMTRTQLAGRIFAQLEYVDADGVPVDYGRISVPKRDDNQLAMMAAEFEAEAADLPIYIDDRSAVTIHEVEAQIRLWSSMGVRLVVIDYVQILGKSRPGQTDQEMIAEASGVLRNLAKDLGLAIVLLSQLSRAVESRKDKRPLQSDLRGAGELEQDAHNILFPYRPAVYDDNARPSDMEIGIVKARSGNGDTKPVYVEWIGSQQLIRDPGMLIS